MFRSSGGWREWRISNKYDYMEFAEYIRKWTVIAVEKAGTRGTQVSVRPTEWRYLGRVARGAGMCLQDQEGEWFRWTMILTG